MAEQASGTSMSRMKIRVEKSSEGEKASECFLPLVG